MYIQTIIFLLVLPHFVYVTVKEFLTITRDSSEVTYFASERHEVCASVVTQCLGFKRCAKKTTTSYGNCQTVTGHGRVKLPVHTVYWEIYCELYSM